MEREEAEGGAGRGQAGGGAVQSQGMRTVFRCPVDEGVEGWGTGRRLHLAVHKRVGQGKCMVESFTDKTEAATALSSAHPVGTWQCHT